MDSDLYFHYVNENYILRKGKIGACLFDQNQAKIMIGNYDFQLKREVFTFKQKLIN